VKAHQRPGFAEGRLFRHLLLVLPLGVGLVVWFILAPDPRFAHALFWLASIGASMVLLATLWPLVSPKWFIAIVAMVFMIANGRLGMHLVQNVSRYEDISTTGPYPLKKSLWSSG
jgi:hypothetical protein